MYEIKFTVVPFFPSGEKAWHDFLRCNGNDVAAERIIKYRVMASPYGIGKRFRDWMFDEYGAEISGNGKKCMIRFIDEQNVSMFLMRWS